jgi:hypothetical protein
LGSEWIWREPDKIKGVILSEPGFAQAKEEGETALELDGEKVFFPEQLLGGGILDRVPRSPTSQNRGDLRKAENNPPGSRRTHPDKLSFLLIT